MKQNPAVNDINFLVALNKNQNYIIREFNIKCQQQHTVYNSELYCLIHYRLEKQNTLSDKMQAAYIDTANVTGLLLDLLLDFPKKWR